MLCIIYLTFYEMSFQQTQKVTENYAIKPSRVPVNMILKNEVVFKRSHNFSCLKIGVLENMAKVSPLCWQRIGR